MVVRETMVRYEGCRLNHKKKMIISDKSAIEKLNSPNNLINKRLNAMSLFIPKKEVIKQEIIKQEVFNPFLSIKKEDLSKQEKPSSPLPGIDNLIENNETQVKLSLAHDSALGILNDSIKELSIRLPEIRADKLPSVITAASKVVESIRKERSENSRNGKDREVHHHFYMPQQKKLSDYEIVEGITV